MPEALIKEALKKLPADAPKALRAFLADFFARAALEDLVTMTPALMAKTAQIHWDLSRTRKKGHPAINIYTVMDRGEPGTGRTIIDTVNDDMAFIVDSVAAEVGRQGRLINLLLHPILNAAYDAKGRLTAITTKGGDRTLPESHIHLEFHGALTASLIPALEQNLVRVLKDVGHATRDWLEMRDKLREAQKDLALTPQKYQDGLEESINFLDYVYHDNFTLLGYREYSFAVEGKTVTSKVLKGSLGLLHDGVNPVYINDDHASLPQDLQRLRYNLPPLTVAKINRRSTVHRPVPLDAIAVKRYDKKGNVIGERLFIGLFTSVTYSRSVQDIPLLRRKAANILARCGFRKGGHSHKALGHILERYPRDEFFQISEDDLLATAVSIMRLQERQRIALYLRRDPFGRYISCLIYVPRDRYDTRLRMTIRDILEETLHGTCSDFQTSLDDSVLARVIFTVKTSDASPSSPDVRAIEARLQEAGRLWSEKLADALLGAGCEDSEIPDIIHDYGQAFPVAYCDAYLPKQAVYDIEKIEEAEAEKRLALDLYRDKTCGDNQVRLKLYQRGAPVILSDILPVLENMGLRVITELPFEIAPESDTQPTWIHDFLLTTTYACTPEWLEKVKPPFEEALLHIWNGEMEDDSLNNLVLGARMPWRDIMILRACVHYLRQAGSSFSTRFLERALHRNPDISEQIVELFKALLDPDRVKQADQRSAAAMAAIESGLEKVVSLEEDRILRSILGIVNAALRTNFFQPGPDGKLKPYVAIKLDSRKIEDLPAPKPFREIFVYSPRVLGIHLRMDMIARGGLRWSDRFEDFRTEVLGLMKAQQVKNSLIVPMGAKGGFVVRKPPAEGGRAAYQAEGIECYKLFVRNLLEITDNRKGRRVIPPPRVVRRDGDDPYLVVAADKGTANFSDIANALSAEFGFWLGDGFASGGSAGYDHKKMGITARGAWESVKRHFRELSHDTQSQPFDVIGVGDMAGDVFGNGMILSDKIRMVGAFNHVHIVCDPDPDPAASFAERKRLFESVKGWEEYNVKLLSRGGRIYSRADKSLQMTPEIRARFGVEKDRVTPAELIQALLRAPTDLLWFGGIGTYLKATEETHADVGDKANDALRVSASEIRARVIGEGANLALTQSARVELAENKIKLNADFIDNSGGVNSSDVEVNIKILLNEIMADPAKAMTPAARNKLLAGMTPEVSAHVLRNNYQQAMAISLMELRAPENLTIHASFIDDLERKYSLPRRQEGLPSAEEIEIRLKNNHGLLRPELCTLQAHAKILFTRDILASDIPDRPEMEEQWLVDYFPAALQKKYPAEIRQHRLRREIIATSMSANIINRMGATFVKEMMDRTGTMAADVARAFLIVREAFGLCDLWCRIETMDGRTPAMVQLKAMREITRMAERETLWFLTRLGRRMDTGRDTESFRDGIATLRARLDSVLTPEMTLMIDQRTKAGVADGLPEDLAREVALIRPLGAACDIIRISMDRRTPIPMTATVYYELGEYFHLHWLRQQARFMTSSSRWATEALDGLIEHLYGCQAGLTVRILNDMKKELQKNGRDGIVADWVRKHAPHAQQLEPFFDDLKRTGTIDLPMLIIAEQRLRQLYGG